MKIPSCTGSHGTKRNANEKKNELQEAVETVDRQGYETHGSPEERRHKLGKDENVTTDVLLRICDSLDVELNEIAETVPCEEASAEVRSDAGRSGTRLRQ